jgi:hypothetical protein
VDTLPSAGQTTGQPRRWTSAYRRRLLALSDERAAALDRILAAERAGFDRGLRAGYEQGRRETLTELAAAQRQSCDHLFPIISAPPYERQLIRAWAPPRWRGQIPDGMTTAEARRWLAALPRRGSGYAGGPVPTW